MSEPTFEYDEQARKAVISFPNGHSLRVAGIDKEKAEEFFRKHAAEFAKRDCVLHTSSTFEVRSDG